MNGSRAKAIRKETYGDTPTNVSGREYHVIEYKTRRGNKVYVSTQRVALGLRADYQDAKKVYKRGKRDGK